MDPNEALDNLRAAYSDYDDWRGHEDTKSLEAADRMRDSIEVLDDWLSFGGFLPRDWKGKGSR